MEVEFHGHAFATDPGRVMTPRPASEALVDAALAHVGGARARVVDVGTGSGAVAVAIALHAPRAEVWATDVDLHAVALARRNALRHGVRVRVRQGNLLDAVAGRFDVVAANLPYLPDCLRNHPEYAVYADEPPHAIYAPADGLALYRQLLQTVDDRLTETGALLIQLHRRVLETDRKRLADLRELLAA
jgi:release factor glutamine methyltransferase